VALCQNDIVSADLDCEANADIDNGSYDPDGDPITLAQFPPGPYGLGTTVVTLTVTDDSGVTASCSASVDVVDDSPPVLSCNSPDPAALSRGAAPISFTASAIDNCSSPAVVIWDYECYWINRSGKRFDRTNSCSVSLSGPTITLDHPLIPFTVIEWETSATDDSGNEIVVGCGLLVVVP
jgi:hypothetical protein